MMQVTANAKGIQVRRLLALLPLVALAQPSWAQTTETNNAATGEATALTSDGGEILVTARKRTESLLDSPVAITAYSQQAIQAAGFTNLADVSLQTAGFQFSNQGGQEPGRYNTQLRFRGMNTSQFSPSFATGALFVDGVYVLNGGTSVSLLDIERIEVIKGPQSAYFGRNTFGGAVNFITRTPSLDRLGGQVDALASARGRFDLQALVEGPLVRDKIGLSVGGRLYDKRGHYVATDGGRLGNEQTWALSSQLYVKPSDSFSARFRAFYSEDDDGAPAGGFIDGDLNDSCTGKTFTTKAGETASPRRYICGALPSAGNVKTLTGQKLISSNTILSVPVQQGLVNAPPSFALDYFKSQPQPSGLPSISDYGLRRDTLRLTGLFNYNFNDWNADLVLGYNRQKANWIRDYDVTDTRGGASNDPQSIKDRSIEFRITSPQEARLRALAGVNYYKQDFIAAGEGGSVALYCVVLTDTFNFNNCAFPLGNPSSFANSDKTKVLGLFGSLEFDVTEQLTLIAEGRYQRDRLTKGGAASPTGVGPSAISETFEKFLPRVILRYELTDSTTLYASYALGAIPGDLNSNYIRADARERAQYDAQLPGIGVSTGQELLKAYEVGWKQRAFDNRLHTNIAAYYYDWSNLKGRVTAQINQTCRTVRVGQLGCDPTVNPATAVGQPELISNGSGGLTPLLRGNNVLVTGTARIYGFEAETNYEITDQWDISANVAYAHARYRDYQFNFVQAIAGFSQMKGNTIPRFPQWSGNVSSTYRIPLNDNADIYVRGDAIYFGKAYVDESNLAYAQPYTLINLRVGFERGDLRGELFVNNLFEEDRYAAAARWTNLSKPTSFAAFTTHQGVNVTPQDKREIGIRVSTRF